jgi:hypothetical protein
MITSVKLTTGFSRSRDEMNRPRLEETGRGLTVRVGDRYLYSRYDPEKRAVRIAESVPLRDRCIYLVPSPLLGYGLTKLIERVPRDSIILTIEYSQEIMALCSNHLPQKNERIVNVRLSDRESLHALLYSLGPWRFRRVHRVDLNSGASLNPEVYNELSDFLLEDLMSYWRNRHALDRLGREWIRHIFANISEMASGAIDFRNLRELQINGTPLVAGAGPSLENSMKFMRKNRERLWILAVDTALPALMGNGLTPDAVAVLDTQPWNLLDFHNSAGTGIPVIADLSSYPPCLTHTGGPCYLYSSEFAELNFLRNLKEYGLRDFIIPPLGSVGLAALEIISRISSGPVFLTGLDFAYSPGKSHARGSSFHHWQLSSLSRLNPHPGWEASMRRPRSRDADAFGLPLNTDTVLQGYAALLKDRYSGDERFRVLEPGGLNLDIPLISPKEAEVILSRERLAGSPGGSSEKAAERKGMVDKASSFLDRELKSLAGVIDAWDAYAEGSGSAAKVSESLEGMDEVFADFPDEPPLPKENDSFLVRGVSRVRQLQRYIGRLDQCSSP